MTQPKPATALLYGRTWELLKAVPSQLSRAGFAVTVVTTLPEMRRCRGVGRLVLARSSGELLSTAAREVAFGYDLVVTGDDDTLRQVKRSTLALDEKLRLLPICGEKGLGHIASKIGLSRALAAGGVLTPAFAWAETPDQLPDAVREVGYPLMIKSDFGAGGSRVHPVETAEQLEWTKPWLQFPVVVQKKIQGEETGLNALFHRRVPIVVTQSTMIRPPGTRTTLTSIRRYKTHPEGDVELMQLLGKVGTTLDAHGYCNLVAMRSAADGKLYVFEADMRPNVWINYPKYYGDDPAGRIAAAFGLPRLAATVRAEADEVILTYLPRLPLRDVLSNAYGCRDHHESYAGGGFLMDWLDNRLRALTLRRVVNFLRGLVGLPAKWRSASR